MFEQHHDQIRAEAIAAYPQEAAWLITGDGCKRVNNVADDPEKTFRVSKRQMTEAHKAGLLAVVHSHPDGPDCPSELDMKGQIASGVPWGIVTTDGAATLEPFFWGDGADKAPLIGRGFRHGVTDCYSLIRDYYAQELSTTLPEFPRAWEWHLKGQDLYTEGFEQAGFRKLGADERPRPGDMFLASIRSPVPNHGGALLEGSLILHHLCAGVPSDPERLSRREPIGRWLHLIGNHWYRHKSQDA